MVAGGRPWLVNANSLGLETFENSFLSHACHMSRRNGRVWLMTELLDGRETDHSDQRETFFWTARF